MLPFRTTQEVRPLEGTVGQDKAIRALKLGLSLDAPGYNIFVSGLTGTRKTRTVREVLGRLQPPCALPLDRVYVNNFDEPDRPVLITLPRGTANALRGDVWDMVQYLRENLTQLFLSDDFHHKRQSIQAAYEKRANELFTDFGRKIEKDGFALVQVQAGALLKPEIVPAHEGNPVSVEALEEMVRKGELPQRDLKRREEIYPAHKTQLDNLLRKNLKMHRAFREDIRALEQDEARPVIEEAIREIHARYDNEKLRRFCERVREHMLQNLSRFVGGEPGDEESGGGRTARFPEYQVNVLLDNKGRRGCPVVVETTPTHTNLFGTVERAGDRGSADFTRIKSGSILQADGGYLILNGYDTLGESGVWKTLKRTLIHSQLEIQAPETSLAPSVHLKAEPIDLRVKVILVGDLDLYYALWEADEDFRKIFKVRVDFDSEVPRSAENTQKMASYVSKIVREESLPHFTREAVATLIGEAVRLAGHRGKLTASLTSIADLVREAAYWRRSDADGAGPVRDAHVRRAIEESEQRSNLMEERLRELIAEGTLLIATTGARVGVVNGLSLHDLGNYVFGRPTRITAAVAAGRTGILNIEREAELSGRTHDKGVLILSGFLHERYAQLRPLSLSASLCFEQSYNEIDGDSASAAEIYALLSALSGVPLRQDVAVTGSVNQKGEIQPIGGVNEKIEGFFRVCRERGLTGRQGVLIPKRNIENLMLRDEVVEAVRARRFHIWPMTRIDDGLVLLTGRPAGSRRRDGTFTPGSINDLVDLRLEDYAERVKEFGPEEPPPDE